MKIVHLNTYDLEGGPARAVYNLHQGLLKLGENSKMLVLKKTSSDPPIIAIDKKKYIDRSNNQFFARFIQEYYINQNRVNPQDAIYNFGSQGYDISQHPLIIQADIINLYWLSYFITNNSLVNLFKLGKPIIWTLYDQRPFTGGCHLVNNCRKYLADCKKCPQLKNDPFNLANYDIDNKLILLGQSNLTVVSPSHWLAKLARQSALFKNKTIKIIPYSIDERVFYPRDKQQAKKRLGFREDEIIVLFSCYSIKDYHKGFNYFISAVKILLQQRPLIKLIKESRLKFVVVGKGSENIKYNLFPLVGVGFIENNKVLSSYYQAADIFVLPSLTDNLPQAMLECLACGTPIVAFKTGGIPEVVKEGINGYLVNKGDIISLSMNIAKLIIHKEKRIKFGKAGSQLIKNSYSHHIDTLNYRNIYRSLLKKNQKYFAKSIDCSQSANKLKLIVYIKNKVHFCLLALFALYIKFNNKLKIIIRV